MDTAYRQAYRLGDGRLRDERVKSFRALTRLRHRQSATRSGTRTYARTLTHVIFRTTRTRTQRLGAMRRRETLMRTAMNNPSSESGHVQCFYASFARGVTPVTFAQRSGKHENIRGVAATIRSALIPRLLRPPVSAETPEYLGRIKRGKRMLIAYIHGVFETSSPKG